MSFVTTCFVPFVTICTHLSQFVISCNHLSSLSQFQAISHHLLMSQFDSIVSISHYLTPVLTTRLRCHHLSPFRLTNFDRMSPSVSICQMVPRQTSFVTACFVSICYYLQPFVAIHRKLPCYGDKILLRRQRLAQKFSINKKQFLAAACRTTCCSNLSPDLYTRSDLSQVLQRYVAWGVPTLNHSELFGCWPAVI